MSEESSERGSKVSRIPPIEAVRRAVRVLGCFRVNEPECGISEIARELNLHKSTVHRLLATLEMDGFVEKLDGGSYTLGWRVFELATAIPSWRMAHRQEVHETLSELVQRTGETAYLATLAGTEVLVLDALEGTGRLRVPMEVGSRLPAYCSSLGKSLLSALDDDVLVRLIDELQFHRFTSSTITDRSRLLDELRRIRTQGYAIDEEELEHGLMCVGANVRDKDGLPWAALSVSGPSPRMRARIDECIRAVLEAAHLLSGTLISSTNPLTRLHPGVAASANG